MLPGARAMLPSALAHGLSPLACLPQIVVLLGVGINLVISTSALGECPVPSQAVLWAQPSAGCAGSAGLLDDSRAKGEGSSLNRQACTWQAILADPHLPPAVCPAGQ